MRKHFIKKNIYLISSSKRGKEVNNIVRVLMNHVSLRDEQSKEAKKIIYFYTRICTVITLNNIIIIII